MEQAQQQQVQPQQIQIPPFRLYGLLGCGHCVRAEQFFRSEGLPVLVIIGNDDPIAEAGVKAVTGKSEASFPMLVCTFGKQIVEGFKEDEYRKLADAYRVLFAVPSPGTSTVPSPNSRQQSDGQTAPEAPNAVAGAD